MSEKCTQGSVLDPFHHGMLGLPYNYKLIQDLHCYNALTFSGLNYWVLSMIWCCGCTDNINGHRSEKCSEVKISNTWWPTDLEYDKEEGIKDDVSFLIFKILEVGLLGNKLLKGSMWWMRRRIWGLFFKRKFNVYLILSKSFKRSQIFLSIKRKNRTALYIISQTQKKTKRQESLEYFLTPHKRPKKKKKKSSWIDVFIFFSHRIAWEIQWKLIGTSGCSSQWPQTLWALWKHCK